MTVDGAAKTIWDYMLLHQDLAPADIILALGSADIRTADRAAELYHDGYGKCVVVSGGAGKITRTTLAEPEAQVFAERLRAKGVPTSKILIEELSANTGENIRFTYELLQNNRLDVHSLIIVQKPYMERRAYATFKKQWPDTSAKLSVTSPQISYDEYFTEALPKDLVINVMVGDLQRIREYPKLSFQIEQAIPEKVEQAYEYLIAHGYTRYMIA